MATPGAIIDQDDKPESGKPTGAEQMGRLLVLLGHAFEQGLGEAQRHGEVERHQAQQHTGKGVGEPQQDEHGEQCDAEDQLRHHIRQQHHVGDELALDQLAAHQRPRRRARR